MPTQFRVKFPKVVLPARFGGREAIVMATAFSPKEPNVCFGLCVDSAGAVHTQVPFVMSEIMEAAKRPATFVEVPGEDAPGDASLIVKPRA